MDTQQKEGARWFLILICSIIVSVLAWPFYYFLMALSPIPINLFTTGLPASVISGGAFVLVGQYVSRHRSVATSKRLAIIFTVYAGLLLLRSGGADRPSEYVVMGIFGSAGAWLAYLKLSPNLEKLDTYSCTSSQNLTPSPLPKSTSLQQINTLPQKRCKAIAKSGDQCKRLAMKDSDYCLSHIKGT